MACHQMAAGFEGDEGAVREAVDDGCGVGIAGELIIFGVEDVRGHLQRRPFKMIAYTRTGSFECLANKLYHYGYKINKLLDILPDRV